jgi:hypothetical protein
MKSEVPRVYNWPIDPGNAGNQANLLSSTHG